MAKYAISREGAESMSSLARGLLSSANSVLEASQKLSSATASLGDGLGIYADEISEIIRKNNGTLQRNREDIIGLATRINTKANDILSLISLGLGDMSFAGERVQTRSGISAGSTPSLGRPNANISSPAYNNVRQALEHRNVDHNAISAFGRERSDADIVARLGGGDETSGSCSSLAFAYAGNKAGYDVLDFRDGDSRKLFSSNSMISMIADLPGVDSKVVNGLDDVACADSLLSEMVPDREYYLATGQHASIVRLHNGHYEYLELQSASDNGWHLLHDQRLYDRFGCDVNNTEYPNFLIDVESLSNSSEFLDILGYINTAEGSQRKGDAGYVR